MIEIHPTIQNFYTCPVCKRLLTLRDFVINGMRNLVEGRCDDCGRNYYVDMPVGHGLYYPITLDIDTGEIYDPVGVPWFADQLRECVATKCVDRVKFWITKFFKSKEVVLLNCLDFRYGHCLLKLFNTQMYLDNYSNIGCCVLIPHRLRHLVPEGVAEVWEVDLPLEEFRYWHLSLEEQIKTEIHKKERCYLGFAYPHPHYTNFSLDRFAKRGNSDLFEIGHPLVVFSYREDRLWGRSLHEQQRNITDLADMVIEVFPNTSFVLIGFGKAVQFSKPIIDRRCERFDPEMEQYWIDLLYETDCVVGVHGSNMLLPTGLARCAIELLPNSRYGNVIQDYLPNPKISDPQECLFRFRIVYGNRDLSDIAPDRVGEILLHQLDGLPRFQYTMRFFWQNLVGSDNVADPHLVEVFRRRLMDFKRDLALQNLTIQKIKYELGRRSYDVLEYILDLGRNYAERGEYKKAEEKFKEVLALEGIPNQARFHAILSLSNCYSSQGKYRDAEHRLKEALSLEGVQDSSKVFAHYAIGSIYESRGEHARAQDRFEAVLAMGKEITPFVRKKVLGNAHFHLGCIYRSLGEKGKAKGHFEECLRLIPTHRKAKESLKVLVDEWQRLDEHSKIEYCDSNL